MPRKKPKEEEDSKGQLSKTKVCLAKKEKRTRTRRRSMRRPASMAFFRGALPHDGTQQNLRRLRHSTTKKTKAAFTDRGSKNPVFGAALKVNPLDACRACAHTAEQWVSAPSPSQCRGSVRSQCAFFVPRVANLRVFLRSWDASGARSRPNAAHFKKEDSPQLGAHVRAV